MLCSWFPTVKSLLACLSFRQPVLTMQIIFSTTILTCIPKQVPIPFLPQVYSKIVLLLWRAYLARIKRGYLKAPWHAVENEWSARIRVDTRVSADDSQRVKVSFCIWELWFWHWKTENRTMFFLKRGALDARLKRSESCKILKHQFTCCCHLLVNIRRPTHSLKSSSLKGVPVSAQLTLMNWT